MFGIQAPPILDEFPELSLLNFQQFLVLKNIFCNYIRYYCKRLLMLSYGDTNFFEAL